MSEYVALGEADAEARWIGIRRHQAALVIVGLGLAGDWVISPRAPVIEVVVGVVLLLCAASRERRPDGGGAGRRHSPLPVAVTLARADGA